MFMSTEVLLALPWGSAIWNHRPEVISTEVATVTRMTYLMMHVRRLVEESRVEQQRRGWREAQSTLIEALDCHNPALIAGAHAVGAVVELASRHARSVVERFIRWRSGADDDALRTITEGDSAIGAAGEDRSSAEQEDPWIRASGANWMVEFQMRQRPDKDSLWVCICGAGHGACM